jgi:hypothetical protein
VIGMNNAIFVKLDNNIGSIVASEAELNDAQLVKCDGHLINRTDYPLLFSRFKYMYDKCKVPNYTNVLKNQMNFYLIAK